MVLFRWNRRALLAGDERLEHSNGRAVNIASDERHPNPLVLGQGLQTADERVSFLLKTQLSDLTDEKQSARDTL